MSLEHEEIAELRRLIEHRRAALGRELREDVEQVSRETFSALKGEVGDEGEASMARTLSETRQAELTRDVDEMRALEAALERMLTGSYGECIDCGRDIAVERLRVEPAAARCIECQEVYERTHAQPGQASL